LLQRVATGDRAAFAALYDRLGGVAYGLARRVVIDLALAEDVTQEAFLNVWITAPTFDPSRGDARTWILMVTHRRAVDAIRREEANRRRLRNSAPSTTEQPYDVVLDQVLQRSAARCAGIEVTQALSALTPLQREAIVLAYFHGLTRSQVAQLLDVPLSTAKTRIRDGLIRLAVQMRPPART
jgi:RNA polymerase sigma-70 factor (ECF subfamily)